MKLLEVFKKLLDGIWIFVLSIIFFILLIPILIILFVFTIINSDDSLEDVIEKE